MQDTFPLISPLVMPFAEVSASAPMVRERFSQIEKACIAEMSRLQANESRRQFWALLAIWAARNEANVAGIIAGRAEREGREAKAADAGY